MYDASSAKKPTPFKSKVYKAMDKTVDTILAPIDKIENMPQDKLAKLYNNFINKLENHDFCIKGEHTEEKVNNKWPKEILNVYNSILQILLKHSHAPMALRLYHLFFLFHICPHSWHFLRPLFYMPYKSFLL